MIACYPPMRKLLLPVALLLFTLACTRDQVVVVLTDAKWGLLAGCSQEWVPASDCQIATDGLDTAILVAQQSSGKEVKVAVVKVLTSTEAALPGTSRAFPYIHYLIAFLG